MNIKPYNSYQDTNIEWLKVIPSVWSISKVKHCFIRKNEKANQEDPIVLSLARDGVKVRDISTGEGQIAESYYHYNPVKPGDLLLNPMDLVSGANCSLSEVEGVISPAYINLKANDGFNPKYYDYFFKLQYWAMALFAHGKGVSFENRWTLNNETLMNYYIPVPDEDTQNAIVNFLDKKLSKLDNIIEKDKKFIELLEEKKVALINQVVTKGLDLNVPMKDSGIEWIGEISEHFDVKKLKFLILKNPQYGANCEPESDVDKFDYRYIRITDINENAELNDSIVYLNEEDAKQFILNQNDILFARSGATVGKTYLYDERDGECCFAGYLIRYVLNKDLLDPKYLLYYTFSKSYSEWIKIVSTQATIQNVSAEKYNNLFIPLPNINEQKQIVNFLNYEISKIDKTIEKIQENIDLLNEYKVSLIHNVVTGKIDVRDEA